jgi:hypothetical protein
MLCIKKTVVVVGCGEIGHPIWQLCRGCFEQVLAEDPRYGEPEKAKYPVAAMHVAIPGSLPDFVEIVAGYIDKYDPEIVLISSTTVPGVTDKLVDRFGADKIVHTQVHGKHHGGRMRRDLLRYPKFVATRSDEAFEKAKEILIAMGHPPENIVRLSCPMAGEVVKLLATTFFGYLIVWAQEIERLSEKCGVSYDELMAFTRLQTDDYNIANKFPGVIRGHCVMPNIEILSKTFPSPLWDYLKQSNEVKKSGENDK